MSRKFDISTGAMLFTGALYYLCPPEALAAVLIPVIVHELGHMAVLGLLGLHIKSIKMELKGFCISYFGQASPWGHILAAAAGPAAGLIFALGASAAGIRLESSFLCLSAGISLILSLFNLLPAMPLDGGRIFSQLAAAVMGPVRGGELSSSLSLAVALTVFAAGLWLLISGRGAALLTASVWLLFYQESGLGIVKSREIL